MALNLTDRIAVRKVIVDRCTAAVTSYAIYILADSNATVAQLAWAREAMRSPSNYGEQVSWYFLGNASFIANGSSVTDSDVDYVVQTAINTHFITG